MRLSFFVIFTYLVAIPAIGYLSMKVDVSHPIVFDTSKQLNSSPNQSVARNDNFYEPEFPFDQSRYGTVSHESQKVDQLVNELAVGFAKALATETDIWYVCGERIKKEDWVNELSQVARALLSALDERGLKLNPWGPWGVIYKESRGNRCAIGPNPRKAAYKYKLIDEKVWYKWTEDEIVDVVTSRKWGRRLADLGLGQVVWKREARVIDNGKERIPTAREILSVKYGTKVIAHAMEERTRYRRNRRWKHLPWLFWPGTDPHPRYAFDVVYMVRKMGGPYKALRPKYL